MLAQTAKQPPCASLSSTRYVGGPWFDGLVFYGTAGLALLLGAVMLHWPRSILPLWLLWLWLVDGPHLIATYARTYCDPIMWRQQRRLLLVSLLWLFPGLLIVAAGRLLAAPGLFQLFLAFAALWAYHHALRQHYGFVAIYHNLGHKSGEPRFGGRLLGRVVAVDRWFLYVWLWGGFAVYMMVQPVNRGILGLPPHPFPTEAMAIRAAGAALCAIGVGYVVFLALRIHRGESLRPGLLVLCIAATMAVTLFGVGMTEPLVPYRQSPEQVFMASSIMGGLLHGVPYIGVVLCTNQRRFANDSGSWLARWSRRPLGMYGLLVAASLLYMLLNSARGVTPVGSLWSESSGPGQLFLAFYWGLFFHHYYLDSKIWRVSRDPQLRKELGAT